MCTWGCHKKNTYSETFTAYSYFFLIPIHGAMYLPNKSKLKSLIDMHLIKIHAPAQLSWLVLPIHQLKLELIQISYDANNDLIIQNIGKQ